MSASGRIGILTEVDADLSDATGPGCRFDHSRWLSWSRLAAEEGDPQAH
jgi:hypothetical protein